MAKQIVVAEGSSPPIGPYSLGVWAGDLLFVSGQTPIDPATGTVASDNVAEQAHQTIKNVRAILEAAGLALDNVVKATVFIKNMNDFAAINDVYASYFQKPYPARSCVEVARLPRDVLVEIEVVASR
ncbi:MAG: endoribonuclease L-PSP, putative [Solidesulfovibrio magneticus str. Maddingley MBC34]|uniref:Endoribonuclease L-PSP, putative n=1 Tax=Solidesulfovibrio magneticus str. Maddingley MBC34 TaxID=1206767 RepID=K6FP13_9BACT|nr:MAG: endoribonuclease L-PSP, putative [Solidesulfovibrio magneticus str. Maddingley MBC34]